MIKWHIFKIGLKQSQNVKFYDEYEEYYTIHDDLKVKVVVSTVDKIFSNQASKLTSLGYSDDEIWKVLETASIDDLDYLITKQYTYDQIKPYMQVKGFAFQDMEKYMKVYAQKQNYN